MLISEHKQRGITLVELMIAGTIALMALSTVVTVYSATAAHSSQHLQRAHLNQQLHALVHLMHRDLKRAGYWHFDPAVLETTENPFQNVTNGLRTGSYDGEQEHSCILFSYDLDQDGQAGVGRCNSSGCAKGTDDDNVEQFGFRLRDRRIQSRYGGDDFACDTGFWQSMNDPDIEITELVFVLHSRCLNLHDRDQDCIQGSPRLIQRAVEFRLGGQLVNQPDSNRTISQWVRIRNDRLMQGE